MRNSPPPRARIWCASYRSSSRDHQPYSWTSISSPTSCIPQSSSELGLASALRRYCAESAHRKIVSTATTGEEPRLDDATALAFFRIGQECLMNAAKHSGAANCKVSLTYAHNRITLAVEDHGSGFDLKSAGTDWPGSSKACASGFVPLTARWHSILCAGNNNRCRGSACACSDDGSAEIRPGRDVGDSIGRIGGLGR